MTTTKYSLRDDEVPRSWYNIMADLPSMPPPPLNPGTGQPLGPDDLAPLFPMALIGQEVSTERFIEIPDPIRDVLAMWRPTPLYRAENLEQALGTDCKIFYKYEGVSPAGSHKPNTAIPQAWYNKQEGVSRIATETGAGQWGSALAFSGAQFDLEIKVYQVRASYDAKPYRRAAIETWGGSIVPSPSMDTNAGRAILETNPDHPGSLGIAISEAVEDAATRDDTKYALGSVLNHVLMHQTVIGQEAQEQLKAAGAYPDVVVGCVGGGSNFAGIAFPFLADKIAGKDVKVVAAEPAACPTLTRGHYGYDFGDTAQLTPLLPMHTLGHGFVPQRECFAEAVRFARTEGIIPAPEPTHAIRAVVEEVEQAREEGVSKTILFNLCGHGNFDLAAYDSYFAGTMEDLELPDADLEAAAEVLAAMPSVG